jgi:superfamily I DNA and/or RNA helicase
MQLCKQPITGERPEVEVVKKAERALEALRAGEAQVVGGTAWLWADPDAAGAVDVLVVDEAGQMALPNVLAVAPAVRSLVLCGDPQQLEQPQQAAHPDGSDVSALAYLLGGAQTVPAGRGLFLAETWRLAPAICRFTSEVYYEGRLEPRPENARQVLLDDHPFPGAGLFHVPVLHHGNSNASREEAELVVRIVSILVGASWRDVEARERPLAQGDILVVAPYNAQVDLIAETLGAAGFAGVPVGTVDRFQGQQAPVVVFSTASSSPEDAPRGMEFLYDPHRLNVATSRGRCAAILIASPRLFEPACRTPRQIQLANGFCRFRELATTVRL